MEKKQMEIINLVMRQTNYTKEEVEIKLSELNNNYLAVIKGYILQDKKPEPSIKKEQSINQQIMKELRTFMDNVNDQYDKRTQQKERMAYYRQGRKDVSGTEVLDEDSTIKKNELGNIVPKKLN
jgi:hypothetical protein